MEATYKVVGMTCGGCAASVTKALSRLGLAAEVSVERGAVKVTGTFDDAKVKAAVEAAGFTFDGRA
ncbi:MAG: heavy-metal-associated domain-containing protein [Myxococcota bacterium]